MPERLFALAESEGILVDFFPLPANILGAYYRVKNKPPVILLHKNIEHNRRLLRCIFAEELGHHFKTIFDFNLLAVACAQKWLDAKDERLAIFWAVQYLMPFEDLIKVINNGCFLTHEIAEFFDITERFAGTGIKLYFEKERQAMIELLKKLPAELNYC